MLSDRLEQWKKEFREEGLREGMQEGLREGMREGILHGEQQSLLRLLTRKFGAMPAAITLRISQAPLPDLEQWLDRLLEAKTLDEVFGDDAVH